MKQCISKLWRAVKRQVDLDLVVGVTIELVRDIGVGNVPVQLCSDGMIYGLSGNGKM